MKCLHAGAIFLAAPEIDCKIKRKQNQNCEQGKLNMFSKGHHPSVFREYCQMLGEAG